MLSAVCASPSYTSHIFFFFFFNDPATTEIYTLSLHDALPISWSDVAVRYPLGSKVHGKVVSLTDYGAFIELEEGVEGLIHVSEMSWTKKIRNPSKLLSIGTEVEAD